MSNVYDEFKELFNPELRRRKAAALAAAAENERRKRNEKLVAEVGALAASPVIGQYRDWLLNRADTLMPDQQMDAAGAFWYRRGLQEAVNMLDQILATAEEQNA